MTPAINLAIKAKIDYEVHEYDHDPASASYGSEAAERLGVPEERVFKTLVVDLGNHALAVGIVPVSSMLDLKSIAKALGAKKAAMADKTEVQRVTGYVLGGVSPLGQKNRLPTVIDASAQDFPTVYVSAGRRGLEIELRPHDLATLTGAAFIEICRSAQT